MKPVKITKNGKYHNVYIYENTILEPTKENVEMIKILNEKGFIEPLTLNEIYEIEKNVNKSKQKKEEK